jgi:hypothetical protein
MIRGRRNVSTMNLLLPLPVPNSSRTTSRSGIGKSPTLIDQQPTPTMRSSRIALATTERTSTRIDHPPARMTRPEPTRRSRASATGDAWAAATSTRRSS